MALADVVAMSAPVPKYTCKPVRVLAPLLLLSSMLMTLILLPDVGVTSVFLAVDGAVVAKYRDLTSLAPGMAEMGLRASMSLYSSTMKLPSGLARNLLTSPHGGRGRGVIHAAAYLDGVTHLGGVAGGRANHYGSSGRVYKR